MRKCKFQFFGSGSCKSKNVGYHMKCGNQLLPCTKTKCKHYCREYARKEGTCSGIEYHRKTGLCKIYYEDITNIKPYTSSKCYQYNCLDKKK